MDFLTTLGVSLFTLKENVKVFPGEESKIIKVGIINNSEIVYLIRVNENKVNLIHETLMNLIYINKLDITYILKFKHIVVDTTQVYLSYENADYQLGEYMTRHKLSIEKKLLLFKSCIELVAILMHLKENFDFFEPSLFFINEIDFSFGTTSSGLEKIPIIKYINHGKLIHLFLFLGGLFANDRNYGQNIIPSANYCYWLFYLHFIIFKENPSSLSQNINLEMDLNYLAEYLNSVITQNNVLLPLNKFIEAYNKILTKANLVEIPKNIIELNKMSSTCAFPRNNFYSLNNDTFNNYQSNTYNNFYNNNAQINFNQYFQIYGNNGFIHQPFFQNNFDLFNTNLNFLNSPNIKNTNNNVTIHFNKNINNNINNNNLNSSNVPITNHTNPLVFTGKSCNLSTLPKEEITTKPKINENSQTYLNNIFNDKENKPKGNQDINNYKNKINNEKDGTNTVEVIVNPDNNSICIVINKKNLNLTTNVPSAESLNDKSKIDAPAKVKVKKQKTSYDYKNINNSRNCFNDLNEAELDFINEINNPRRKKNKSIFERKNLFNEKSRSLKKKIKEFTPLYEEELKKILEEKGHSVMKNHFPTMYNIDNFYLYIFNLNKDRHTKKENSEYIDNKLIENLKTNENSSLLKKIWDFNKLNTEEGNFFIYSLVNDFLFKSEKILLTFGNIFNQEACLEFLSQNDYDIELSLKKIESKSGEFLNLIENKYKTKSIDEVVVKSFKSRRIHLLNSAKNTETNYYNDQ